MKINIEYMKNNIAISNIMTFLREENTNDVKLNNGILKTLLDKNIKEKAIKVYNKIIDEGLEVITIKDQRFPQKLLVLDNCPFCIIVSKDFKYNLNNKIIYMYYNSYFSKPAEVIIRYNYKVIKSFSMEVICEYDEIDGIKIDYLENYLNKENEDKYLITLNNYIFLIGRKIDEVNFCDAMLIAEARYENNIVNKVDYMLEKSLPILIFPNSIFNKNGYFSNYLIKQGADIILNKYDLIFILKSLSC